MSSKLRSKVVELLREDARSVSKISILTHIPEGWIENLLRGATANPQVSRLERLYEALSGKELHL